MPQVVEYTEPKKYYCKTCGRTMDGDQFYTSRRLDRYPNDGKLLECKQCLTRHVDNWDPETYKWILEEIDVPYILDEWNSLLDKYGKDRTKITGTSIVGRYLAKMRMKQYSIYTWEDTERIAMLRDEEKTRIMRASGMSGEQIEEELARDHTPSKPPLPAGDGTAEPAPLATYEPEFNDDLTDEDRNYLTLKWGKMYKPYEWVQLEQYYLEMMNAFDIQTPSHIDYLKLICKTSLKTHQLLDLGDVEGFQKMSKVYDSLMKSAKFTAAQNKTDSGEFINSISELTLLCEKEGFIPRFYVESPKDKADAALNDMRGYTRTLVTEEMNLGNLIEGAVKSLQRAAEVEAEDDIDIDDDDEEIIEELNDSDYEEYYDQIDEEQELDQSLYTEGGDS